MTPSAPRLELGAGQLKAMESPNINKILNEKEKKELWGARHTVAFMGFIGFASLYSMRVNINVAIVAMTGHSNTTSDNNSSWTDGLACPLPSDYANGTNARKEGEFDWDATMQGFILSSYYYGYVLTNLLGGRAAERYGGRLVLGTGILFTGICSLLVPVAARTSVGVFIAVRVLSGMFGGVCFPAMHSLLAAWVLPEERSVYTVSIYAGYQFGTVVTMALSGIMCDSDLMGGWPSVFYIFGILALVWSVFWFCLVKNTPSEHPRISQQELKMLQPLSLTTGVIRPKSVPWRSILTSVPYWGTVCVHVGSSWGFYTLLTELPTYLDQIQHFNLSSNGVLSAMPYAAMFIFSQIFGQIANKITKAGVMSTVNVRRLAACIAGYIPMLSVAGLCFVGCDRTAAIIVLCLAVGSSGSMAASFQCTYLDMAPRYAGTIMGFGITLANLTGIVAPLLTGIITDGNQTIEAWSIIFGIAAVSYGITTTVYNFTVTAEIQPWNYHGTEPIDKKNTTKDEPNPLTTSQDG